MAEKESLLTLESQKEFLIHQLRVTSESCAMYADSIERTEDFDAMNAAAHRAYDAIDTFRKGLCGTMLGLCAARANKKD